MSEIIAFINTLKPEENVLILEKKSADFLNWIVDNDWCNWYAVIVI